MSKLVFAVAVLVAACGSPSNSGGAAGTTTGGSGTGPLQCAAREGSYSMRYLERSGNCGALTEQIVQIQASPAPPDPNCTVTSTTTADNCSIDFDVTCNDVPDRLIGEQLGRFTFGLDGAHGAGTLQLTIRSATGALVCLSTYDVTLSRL